MNDRSPTDPTTARCISTNTDPALLERYGNFARSIERLRAAGHQISQSEADDLFIKAEAHLEQQLLLARLTTN